jgi:hypothetical protein
MTKKRITKKKTYMTIPGFIRNKFVVAAAAVLAAAALVAFAVVLMVGVPKSGPTPTTFGECAQLYKVTGTMPRTCTVPFGKAFVEYDGNANTVGDDVRLNLPAAAVLGPGPFKLSGMAKSDWFSAQKTLSIKLVAGTGAVIAQVEATQAPQGTPAPEGYMAFTTSLDYPAQTPGSTGAIVITKPDGSQSLVTPIAF